MRIVKEAVHVPMAVLVVANDLARAAGITYEVSKPMWTLVW